MTQTKMLHLKPQFKEKIWGGRGLATDFGYDIPEGKVGECWAISAHPAGDCQILDEEFSGYTLSELYRERRDLFGNIELDEFPLLIKILDASDDLSIQVHPDDTYAKEHENSLGKRECWYVLHADPGTHIIVGQNAPNKEAFQDAVNRGAWDEVLNKVPVNTGDFFQIEPGTVHAIMGNTMVLETQQSSDVTYRVYDYDRVQDDGSKRPLHLQQSLDVIDFKLPKISSGHVSAKEQGGITTLVRCASYVVERIRPHGMEVTYTHSWPFLCISVVEGSGSICGENVTKGTHLLALSNEADLSFSGEMEVIVSHLV